MKFACEKCDARYQIPDHKIGPKGAKVRCKNCGHVNIIRPPKPPEEEASSEESRAASRAAADVSASASAEQGLDASSSPPAPSSLTDGGGMTAELVDFQDALRAEFEESSAEDALEGVTAPESERAAPVSGPSTADLSPSDASSVESELGSAFHAMFGTDASEATNLPEAPPPSPPIWFFAVDDEQVGPVTFEALEAHWAAGAIGPSTLCWREGMGDWLPIREVDEMFALPDFGLRVEEAADGASEDLSFEGMPKLSVPRAQTERAPREKSAVGWKPSAASALDALADEELESASASQVPPASLAPPIPSKDITASLTAAPGPAPGAAMGPPPADVTSVASPVVPAAPAGPSGPSRARASSSALAAAVAALVLLLGGAGWALFGGGSGASSPPPPPPPQFAVAKTLDAGAPAVTRDVGEPEVLDAGSQPVVDAGVVEEPPPAAPVKRRSAAKRSSTPSPKRKRRPSEDVKKSLPPPPKPPSRAPRASGLPKEPDQGDVFRVLRSQQSAVKDCLEDQRRADPSLRGQMRVSLKIAGSGRVQSVSVSPSQFRDAPVGRCISRKAKRWRFPEFSGPLFPVDFPVKLGG